MISLRFGDFRDGKYKDELSEYQVYILKDSTRVLYVGCTTAGMEARWFGGWGRSHLSLNVYGEWFPGSPAGSYILKNAPQSDDWIVEFLTFNDCASFLGNDVADLLEHPMFFDAKHLEPLMIRKLHPLLNTAHNSGGEFIPGWSWDDLKDAHHKIFE